MIACGRVRVNNMLDAENEPIFRRRIQQFNHLRESVNWETEKDRCNLLDQLLLFCGWFRHLKGVYPNLRELFQPEEIERLLMDSLTRDQYLFINFVISCDFKDEPKADEEGNLLLRRTTALHHAVNLLRYQEITQPKYQFNRRTWADDQARVSLMVRDLFKIYDRFDVNYTDDDGFTHLHAACMYGIDDAIEKFLGLGQDPNCLEHVTGNSPLHLAAASTRRSHRVIALLLNGGADPNLANAIGWTPLHIISQRYRDDNFMEEFFKMCERRGIALQVDARDKLGRTPLQWAVLCLKPRAVDVLLDRGADLSKFVFPTESYFADRKLVQEPQQEQIFDFKLRLGSGALAVVERLENRGYELNQSQALSIMKFFAKYGLFENSAYVDERWYDDAEFSKDAKIKLIKRNLSLYDLIWLRPEEEDKLLTYEDYFEFAYARCLSYNRHSEVCAVHLCEKLSRGFFQRWALYPFWELIHQRLSIDICEMIVEKLRNEDLYNICLVMANQSDTHSERNTITSTMKSNNKRPRENEDLKPSKKLRD